LARALDGLRREKVKAMRWLASAENEWLASTDPDAMLDLCPGGWDPSDVASRPLNRKLRLFAVACCCWIWHWLSDSRSQAAVLMAERFADGLATSEVLEAAGKAARARVDEVVTLRDGHECLDDGVAQAAECAWSVTEPAPITAARCCAFNAMDAFLLDGTDISVDWQSLDPQRIATAERPYVHLLHDVFGNPFQPITVDPSWLTPVVVALAAAAYEERDMPSGELDAARLAVLADALEEAGCDNADILTHLRGRGPHVRGCWPVDLLLAKK
jgi:hypothetical protein